MNPELPESKFLPLRYTTCLDPASGGQNCSLNSQAASKANGHSFEGVGNLKPRGKWAQKTGAHSFMYYLHRPRGQRGIQIFTVWSLMKRFADPGSVLLSKQSRNTPH